MVTWSAWQLEMVNGQKRDIGDYRCIQVSVGETKSPKRNRYTLHVERKTGRVIGSSAVKSFASKYPEQYAAFVESVKVQS